MWPDAKIKVAQIFQKSSLKSPKAVFILSLKFLKIAQKVTKYVGYFAEKITTNNFHKSPNLVTLLETLFSSKEKDSSIFVRNGIRKRERERESICSILVFCRRRMPASKLSRFKWRQETLKTTTPCPPSLSISVNSVWPDVYIIFPIFAQLSQWKCAQKHLKCPNRVQHFAK